MTKLIDANDFMRRLTLDTSKGHYGEFMDGSEVAFTSREIAAFVEQMPTLTPPNEPMTWEELKSETKINPVYSVKYGWIFPSTVKDEPYKQIWFFTSKGFAQTELFYRDTFYRHPPEGEEDTP